MTYIMLQVRNESPTVDFTSLPEKICVELHPYDC
jgi:hypothetical protein